MSDMNFLLNNSPSGELPKIDLSQPPNVHDPRYFEHMYAQAGLVPASPDKFINTGAVYNHGKKKTDKLGAIMRVAGFTFAAAMGWLVLRNLSVGNMVKSAAERVTGGATKVKPPVK